jgi:HPt (histidine-containing phosphotransfer) domain-containing protein
MAYNLDSNESERVVVHAKENLAVLIPRFLDNRWEDVDAIDDAVVTGDFETVFTLGHSMKHSGGNFGFGAITDIGKSLEVAARERDEEKIQKWLKELAHYLEIVEVEYE